MKTLNVEKGFYKAKSDSNYKVGFICTYYYCSKGLKVVRLALGTRVGISEEEDEENVTGEDEIDHAKDIYSWLTWLQSNLLEEMNS